MPEWKSEELNKVVKEVKTDEVKSYLAQMFSIMKWNNYDLEKYNKKEEDCNNKTFVLSFGSSYEGDYIDLFQMQEWFDKNREWIDDLRKQTKE